MAKLSAMQQLFVAHYCACWNATEAAIKAGYSPKSARSIGSENLTKPDIDAAIRAQMKQIYPAPKVLVRLAEHADGSMEDFFVITEEEVVLFEEITVFGKAVKTKRETVHRPVARIDVKKGIEAGKGRLIKKYSMSERGVSIELYDAHAAQVQIGKFHGLFTDRVEHSGTITKETAAAMTDEEFDAELERRGLL